MADRDKDDGEEGAELLLRRTELACCDVKRSAKTAAVKDRHVEVAPSGYEGVASEP